MREGFIIINKPKGVTSFSVVYYLRKITGVKKIGHCGTLDPLATGILVCAIGRSATREISRLLSSDKEYIATLELGKTSATYDAEGKLRDHGIQRFPDVKTVRSALAKFVGEINQIPPIYSAKKIGGKRAYKLARSGKEVVLKPTQVTIYNIKLLSYKKPYLEIKISCGSGTYIRSLANDVGKLLGTGAYILDLKRTKVGKYRLNKAIDIEKLNSKNWFKKIFLL